MMITTTVTTTKMMVITTTTTTSTAGRTRRWTTTAHARTPHTHARPTEGRERARARAHAPRITYQTRSGPFPFSPFIRGPRANLVASPDSAACALSPARLPFFANPFGVDVCVCTRARCPSRDREEPRSPFARDYPLSVSDRGNVCAGVLSVSFPVSATPVLVSRRRARRRRERSSSTINENRLVRARAHGALVPHRRARTRLASSTSTETRRRLSAHHRHSRPLRSLPSDGLEGTTLLGRRRERG